MYTPWLPVRAVGYPQLIERIELLWSHSSDMLHIASLNPELYVQARQDESFARVLRRADAHIIDGAGFALGLWWQGVQNSTRLTGTDLLVVLAQRYARTRRVVYLGGAPHAAEKLAAQYGGIAMGAVQRQDVTLIDKVCKLAPELLFVAFGSPYQEKWIESNRERLRGVCCIGVGGAFDMASGVVARAPQLVRTVGFEWLYRLITQPWRYKRQRRLGEFALKVAFGIWRLV